jgi:arylsulfatase A-like enzyme
VSRPSVPRLAALVALLVLIGGCATLLFADAGEDGAESASGNPDPFLPLRSAGPGSGKDEQAQVRPGRQRGRPNIVVLMADDLDLDTYARTLEGTRAALGAGGTEFEQAFVSTPLCCPSRAAFLSGRYGHNNGILENDPGYPLLENKEDVLPVWLSEAGYRTAMVGKFMNGWERTEAGARGEPAPGWDEWVEMRRTFGYYDYELNLGGESRSFGSDRDDYLTDVLSSEAVGVIERTAALDQPLFLWMSWWAPHPELSGATEGECRGSAIPPDREPGGFADRRLPGGPAIDEPDISDKPAFLRERRELRPHDRRRARTSFRCRLASMATVEEGVGAIIAALDRSGELEDTAFVLTSDNGFFHLEHRLPDGKGLPYEEAIAVPLLIDLPASMGRQARRTAALASNIDLAPTILDLAGADACRAGGCADLDGLSLLATMGKRLPRRFAGRQLLIESTDGRPCGYSAIRSRRVLYVEHEAKAGESLCPPGQRELYSVNRDPAQLENLLAAKPAAPGRGSPRLRRTLDRLHDCAGTRSAPVPGRAPCG